MTHNVQQMELKDIPSSPHSSNNMDKSQSRALIRPPVTEESPNESAEASDNGYSKYLFLKDCLERLKVNKDLPFIPQINKRFNSKLNHTHYKIIEIYVYSYGRFWTWITRQTKRKNGNDAKIVPEDESITSPECVISIDKYIASDDELREGCKLFPFLLDLDKDRLDSTHSLHQYIGYAEKLVVYNLLACMNADDTLTLLKYLKGCPELVRYLSNLQMHDIGTWLHAVVMNKTCNEKIVESIIDDFKVSPGNKNEYGQTALHVFYIHHHHPFESKSEKESLKKMISWLSGKEKLVLLQSDEHGNTPVQLFCYRKQFYDAMSELLMDGQLFWKVNVLVNGFPDIEMIKITEKNRVKFWINVFEEKDRSALIANMKDIECFKWRMFTQDYEFKHIYSHKFEFGKACDNEMSVIYEESFKRFTNLPEILKFPGVANFHFYHSPPYMALIIGRWDLVMPLIAANLFNVVPYCLLTCAAYFKMQQLKNVKENVCRKANEMHQNADAYLAEIVNAIEQKHAGRADYNIVQDYLTKDSSFFDGSLMDIGYFSDCKQFFKTSSCQKALTDMWNKGRNGLSPFWKFVVHSLTHIGFLLLLFSVLLTAGYKWMLYVKIFCYFYGLGYFVEEVRQMVFYCRVKHWKRYFRDATNVIDLLGLLSFLVAFCLQCALWGQIKQSFSIIFCERLFLCLTAIFLSVRLLYFLSVFKTFGPKLKMIEHMIYVDLLPVSVIFLVFIISFGVAFQSLIHSDFSNKTISIERNSSSTDKGIIAHVADILWQPTFTIFEPKYVIEQATESKSPSIQNPMMNLAVQFLLIMFIIIVSVMLMNMLIALFSKTVTDVELTVKNSWALYRWKLIREYMEKSSAPPPLNIFERAWLLMESYWERYKCTCSKTNQADIETGKETDNEAKKKIDEETKKETDIKTDNKTDRHNDDIHQFTILFLMKEDRFELLEKSEESDIVDNIPKMMKLQRKKMEKLEEMLKKQKDQLDQIYKGDDAKGKRKS